APPPVAPLPHRSAENLRRFLLGLITALLVARPLVLGEDPGLLDPLSSGWGLAMTLLWLLAAVGWALWRMWTPQSAWRGSFVAIGLLGMTALMFLTAALSASYQHPATLIAWEWTALLMGFCLIRQLARGSTENAALLAAMLASCLALSVYAVGQYFIELP